MAMTAAHKNQAQAMGLNATQIQQLEALNIDWQKLLAALPQLIALIMSMFGNQPTPQPVVPPVQNG